MTFPTNWAQTWIQLPTLGAQTSMYLQWWLWSGHFVPDPFVWPAFCDQVVTWWMSGLGQILNGDGSDGAACRLYLNDAGTIYNYASSEAPVLYNDNDTYPYWKNLIIQRNFGSPRSQAGHFALPGIIKGAADDNHLTDSALFAYQSIANSMPPHLSHSGVTFHAVTVSYKNSTATAQNTLTVSPTLGCVRRRGKLRYRGPVNPTFPKAPPP